MTNKGPSQTGGSTTLPFPRNEKTAQRSSIVASANKRANGPSVFLAQGEALGIPTQQHQRAKGPAVNTTTVEEIYYGPTSEHACAVRTDPPLASLQRKPAISLLALALDRNFFDFVHVAFDRIGDMLLMIGPYFERPSNRAGAQVCWWVDLQPCGFHLPRYLRL